MSAHDALPATLFLLRGEDRGTALSQAEALLASAAAQPLSELARTISAGSQPVQVAIVARDAEELASRMASVREGARKVAGAFMAPEALEHGAKVAFLFPGQGSQRVGMLRELFAVFPELDVHLARGARWRDIVFPPPARDADEEAAQQAAITDTRVAQPALGIGGLAIAQLLQAHGVVPDMLAGHSYGELVALTVAGALSADELLDLSALRGQRILESCADAPDAGTMAAVSGDRDAVVAAIAGLEGVVIANENSPEQLVISGPTAGVDVVVERLLETGIAAKRIAVACAFHSPLVSGACETFARDLAKVQVSSPALPVYSNTTTDIYPADPVAIRALLARHIGEPVHFVAEIEAMYAAGARVFVEVGPGRVLTGLVGRILGKRPHAAIACDRAGEDSALQYLQALGQLAALGVRVDVERL